MWKDKINNELKERERVRSGGRVQQCDVHTLLKFEMDKPTSAIIGGANLFIYYFTLYIFFPPLFGYRLRHKKMYLDNFTREKLGGKYSTAWHSVVHGYSYLYGNFGPPGAIFCLSQYV